MATAPKISTQEVAAHSSPDDCWLVVNGKVYDLTAFAPDHPGGAQMITKYAGKDGSKTYNMFHAADMIENQLSHAEKKGALDEATVDQAWLDAQREPQQAHQLDPGEKPPLSTLINLDDFEQAFYTHGPAKPVAYCAGASNDLLTLAANKASWRQLWFRPRVMRPVKDISTRMRMLGVDVKMPVWICPMGIAKTAGEEGETALARGAQAAGIVHCMSTAASYGVEDILAAAPTHPFFFQLYVDRDRAKTEALLRRLNGMKQLKALFVTVDLAVVSKREADERLRSEEEVVTSQYAGAAAAKPDKRGGGLARTTGNFIDWCLSWDDIPWLRAHTRLPIVVKGIQSAADARMALIMGCDGIVVSNHGGRALDSAPATLLVLLELRRDCPEIFSRMDVLVDGGVRRGSDVLKAVCLGAKGVGVGRPFQCAVMYGTEGVETVGEILQDELETAMRLCGVTDLDKARGDLGYLNCSELERMLPPSVKRGWFGSLKAML